jgi:hypothetical protein
MESGLSELGVSYALTEDQFREVHSIKTFRDLLVHADPPEDLLNLVKQFAKAHLSSGASPLPREVAQVLYFGAIVSGLLQGYRAISSLSPGEVRRGAEWAMRLPWMDEDMLRLFKRYINRGTGEGQDCRA